jgi:hypothetical protein
MWSFTFTIHTSPCTGVTSPLIYTLILSPIDLSVQSSFSTDLRVHNFSHTHHIPGPSEHLWFNSNTRGHLIISTRPPIWCVVLQMCFSFSLCTKSVRQTNFPPLWQLPTKASDCNRRTMRGLVRPYNYVTLVQKIVNVGVWHVHHRTHTSLSVTRSLLNWLTVCRYNGGLLAIIRSWVLHLPSSFPAILTLKFTWCFHLLSTVNRRTHKAHWKCMPSWAIGLRSVKTYHVQPEAMATYKFFFF